LAHQSRDREGAVSSWHCHRRWCGSALWSVRKTWDAYKVQDNGGALALVRVAGASKCFS